MINILLLLLKVKKNIKLGKVAIEGDDISTKLTSRR